FEALILQSRDQQIDQVIDMNPRNILTPRAEGSAGTESKREHHSGQGTPLWTKDNSKARYEDSGSGCLSREGGRFPISANSRQKIVCWWRIVLDTLVAAITVISDRARGDEDLRARARVCNRACDFGGELESAFCNRALAVGRPAPGKYRFAR